MNSASVEKAGFRSFSELTSCVTLGRLPNLLEPNLLPQNVEHKSDPIRFWEALNEMMYAAQPRSALCQEVHGKYEVLVGGSG